MTAPPVSRAAEDAADWTLIGRIGGGDEAALAELYRRYHGHLQRFVRRITRQPDCCDEVINDVLLVVWRKAAVTEPLSKASTWILGIAYRRALKVLERQGRDPVAFDDEALESVATDDVADQISAESMAEQALALLSPAQRAVMELVYFHGLHYQEIAAVLECPENTVKTRVFHARKRLRECWPLLSGIQTDNADDSEAKSRKVEP
jgi:RNA polymerase sigma-70 factor (ECF subfamily)